MSELMDAEKEHVGYAPVPSLPDFASQRPFSTH